jgi:hypothetical protein
MNDPSSPRHTGPAVLGLIVLVIAGALALSVDVPRTTYGLKSDEATYIAATLSVAHDGNLSFERRDLERFAGLYHSGPEGIVLKRGKELRVRLHAPFPFVHIVKRDDPRADRLFFGKAVAYSIVAAPFVRLFGLNGFLLFQVILLAAAALAAYVFLSAQMAPASAVTLTTAFLGASAVPLYGAFLMPEIFNLTLVTLAYFCWAHKHVAPRSWLAGGWTDVVAAVLLGIATYSKPLPSAILVAPIVLLAWMNRDWMRGFALGATAVLVAGLLFAFNVAVSGEANYQGGDRKIFYGRFPFDAPDFTWASQPARITTDASTPREVLTSPELPARFARNVKYFLVGRHFGFVPYFFPGVVAVCWWLASGVRWDRWRQLTFGAAFVAAVVLLLYLPWTWNGGGGSPANRYFLTAYPALLFLMPPGVSVLPGVLAWAGGALFTAKMLTSPFVAAKYPYLLVEKGPARRLPVEMTMANDLPQRIAQPLRAHILYRNDPGVLLYFLDQNAWPPEPTHVGPDGSPVHSMWASGAGRAEIIVRTPWPIDRIEAEAESPIHTVFTVALGAEAVTIRIEPKKVYRFSVKAAGVRGFGDYNYLLTTHSTEGFIPHLMELANMDYRNLGAALRFRPVTVSEAAASAGTPSPR